MSISGFHSSRFSPTFRVLAAFVCFCFLYEILVTDVLRLKSSEASAQVMNMPTNLVMPSAAYLPPALKAIHIDPQSPLEIDFIIDSADQSKISQQDVNKLVQYFLASMTTPEQDMWVNLSPYESQRIIAPQFGETSAGRELLAQDQLLKQLAASLTYPESETGKAFWARVYQKAINLYGTTAIPIDTFQRVWIMPGKAVVYEHNGTAFITESHLKVLLEDDYIALKNAQNKEGPKRISESEAQKVNNFSATVTREIVLPEIEKEINEGKNFAALRQVFNALILATWFKKKLKQHILARAYVDRKKVKGIEDDSERTAEKIYQQYIQVLKEGVYNYVREDFDASSQSVIPRQYFSGGFTIGNTNEWMDIRPISNMLLSSRDFLLQLGRKLLFAKVSLRPLGVGGALEIPVATRTKPEQKKAPAFNRWAAGLLAGIMLSVSNGAANPVTIEPLPMAPPAQTLVVDGGLINPNAVSLEDLDHIENRAQEVKEIKKVSPTQAALGQLSKKVSLDDVLALDGKINKQTGQAYKIDGEYFKKNWDRVFTDQAPEWTKPVLVLAYQHKLGLKEDGQIGPTTQVFLQMGTPQAQTSTSDLTVTAATVKSTDTLTLGQTISSEDVKVFTALKETITLDDVVALNQVVNHETGKTYQVDQDYFSRNWDTLFASRTYNWPQQTAVIAAQNKFNLRQDGQLGRETRKAIMAEADKIRARISAAPPPPNPQAKLGQGGPPPGDKDKALAPASKASQPAEAKTWFGTLTSNFNYLNNLLFEILLAVLVGLQTFRIYRDSKHNLSDRVELLRILTKYLQGDSRHVFSNQSAQLISKQTSLSDMTARAVGNQVEIIIRSSNSLQGRKEKKQRKATEHAIKNAIADGDFRLMSGTNILELKRLERFDTRIHMYFEMPAGEKVNGKGVTVYYRGEDSQLKSFQMSVVTDAFKELEDAWEERLNRNGDFSEADVEELVGLISEYRQKNPPAFKDFRNQAVVAFKMRKLASATMRKIRSNNIRSGYGDYFYHLGQYANTVRYLLAQCATLDTYKSSFLPEKDELNKKILGLSIDKLYRVVTLVEHAYYRAQNNARNRLAEYYNRRKILDQFELQLQQSVKDEGDASSADAIKDDYTVGSLTSEFDQFSMSFEKPYSHSIVGLDLFRRHGKIMKSIKDLVFLFSPFILFWWFGSSLSIWVPFVLGIFVFIAANYFAPNLSRFFTFYEYRRFDNILTVFKPAQVPEDFASPVLNKDHLLNYVTDEFLPRTRWSDSQFVLAATKFSDVKAIRENSYVEVRFIADSHFMTSGKGEDVFSQVNQAVKDGRLSFRISLNDGEEEITPDRIIVSVHPTGIRLRITNVDQSAESINFLYNGEGSDDKKSYILAITNDTFKQLINQWDHFLDATKENDFSGLDALIAAIKEFYKPGSMNLTDFRKNAGFYHLIREHAFATYEALVVNGGREVDDKYRKYFLELARYSTEVRFLSASFAGMDSLKSWYLPDGDFFRRKIFGFPISRILRAIFGVSFLYSWARTDTLKSIQRVTAQWQVLEEAQNSILSNRSNGQKSSQAIEQKLKAEFEKADFSFRYPAKNSLVGNDKYSRNYGMWIMTGFLVTLIITIGIIVLPFFISAVNAISVWLGGSTLLTSSALVAFLNQPQFLGLSIVNFSVVFYVIAYWINPIHGNNAMERERNSYFKIIESYEKNSSHGEMQILQNKRRIDSVWSQAFYYFSYVLGIFSPTVIMGYFLYQQIQSRFWKNNNVNGNGHKQVSAVAAEAVESHQEAAKNKGGIDLQVEKNLEVQGHDNTDWGAVLIPELLMQDMRGMDFKILELTPIINPPMFMPDFVKGNGNTPQQLLSFKLP
ncbi:MAG: hypothetical protein IT395_07150 [Candidatus Omnitrophica bacterium]|nr:hypothetical protein [Candidatus Omnitrophota bacterium]